MEDPAEDQPARPARYDGWADWYDEYLTAPLYKEMPAQLARLVGPGRGRCLDLGCGTGVDLPVLEPLGWSVIGVDLSADQLRLASDRWQLLVQADVSNLPFPSEGFQCCTSVLTLTDFDDVGAFFREAYRVLARSGRLVVIGTHPCFVGPFVEMEGGAEGVVKIHPGYHEARRTFVGPGIGNGIRAKVGVRHVPLAELLNELVGAGFQLERVEELGDGTVPWLFAFVASKPFETGT
jgi:SAM-dependent methyltransferase